MCDSRLRRHVWLDVIGLAQDPFEARVEQSIGDSHGVVHGGHCDTWNGSTQKTITPSSTKFLHVRNVSIRA